MLETSSQTTGIAAIDTNRSINQKPLKKTTIDPQIPDGAKEGKT